MRTAADLPEDVRDLIVRGRDAWREQDYEQARALFEAALRAARRAGDTFARAVAYHFLGNVAFNECRDDESRRLHRLALDLSRRDGDDQGIATSLGSLALVDVAAGDLEAARSRFAAAAEAYERAAMPDAATGVRETAEALLVRRVKLDELVHRRGAAPPGSR